MRRGETMTKEQLGDFITQQRKAQGMTQKDLAQRLHVTDKAVSKWERGLSYPDVTLLEPLAAALGLSVEELMSCKETNEREAVNTLMDISRDNLRQRKLRDGRRLAGVLILVALTVALLTYVTTIGHVKQEEDDSFWTETVEGVNYVYLEKEEHLLKLKCGENVDFAAIQTADTRTRYHMDYIWNKRTYEGKLLSCTDTGTITLGSLEDADWIDPSSTCIFGQYGYLYNVEDYHRNPYGDGYLCDYRFWYYTEDRNLPLLLINDCLNAIVGDIDGDGENEVIVRTYYIEKPYAIYDDTTGTIEPTYADDIPAEFKEQLVCIWEQGRTSGFGSVEAIAPSL